MDMNNSDARLRRVLGDNLQTGALRAILLLAGFAALGALVAVIVR